MKNSIFVITAILCYICLFSTAVIGQVVINEVVSLNTNGITDEDAEYADWIELYNIEDSIVNLDGYSLSDRNDLSQAWVFPEIKLAPRSYLVVYASGKDRKNYQLNYKTIIDQGATWQYFLPTDVMPDEEWRTPGFDASSWETGKSGFGYGDGDDQTVINPLQVIFIRKEFEIEHPEDVQKMILHVDYDDGFVAFMNGYPVAMENVNLPSDNYNNASFSGTDHEAQLYTGGTPSEYHIDLTDYPLNEGTNVISIQAYNVSAESSDFSIIPFLTLASSGFTISDVPDFIELSAGGNLHTGFKINNKGESLYLFNQDQELIDSLYVEQLPANKSYGRYPDGNEDLSYLINPTPGAMNDLPLDSVFFSFSAGIYSGNISLELHAKSVGTEIRFTTDGSDPNNNSQLYTEAIEIGQSTVVRAVTFNNGIPTSDITTSSYLINTEHQLPVFSLTTDPYNLEDYEYGIYVLGPNASSSNPFFGANFWEDWERPVHIEYFDENKEKGLSLDAGVKISGNWSRANAQKSLALFARNSYGKGKFDYPLFKDRKFEGYEAFVLRNSGNDWYHSMLRDGFVSELVKPLNMERLAYQPAVVYINGVYWGIHNIREKPNESYFENHFNVDEEDLSLIENRRTVIYGSIDSYDDFTDFIEMNDLFDTDNYAYVKSQIDIDCFIDYQITEIYINNGDWPGNNLKFWRSDKASSKWRWLIFDTDFGFDIDNESNYRENTIQFATDINNSGWPNPQWSTLLLRKLLENNDFQNQFINRMADLLNSTFLIDPVLEKLDSIVNIIQDEIPAHKGRWGQNQAWENKIETIERFIKNRPLHMSRHITEYFGLEGYNITVNVSDESEGKVQVNSIVPSNFPFKGKYYETVPVRLTALPSPGYKFSGWEGDVASSNPSIVVYLDKNMRYDAVFEPQTGNEPIEVIINEICYNNTDEFDTGDWVELYNAGVNTIDLSGALLSDDQLSDSFDFPEGTIIYPDQYLVICKDIEKFRMIHRNVNAIGNFKFGYGSTGDEVNLTSKDGDLIDQVVFKVQHPWPIEPSETFSTLALKNPLLDNALGSSWGIGQLGGTPGQPNFILTNTTEYLFNDNEIVCYPSRFTDFTTVQIRTEETGSYKISLLDVQGRLRNEISGTITSRGNHNFDIFTDQEKYQPGLYLVQVQFNNLEKNFKVVKQ